MRSEHIAGPAVMLVSGEASGDRIAAAIAQSLGARGVACFGMGGEASAAAGVALTHRMEPAMGLTDIVAQLPRARRTLRALISEAERRPATAAVLVDYTEFNLVLGRRLRAAGVRVLWCVAPQVWAWRPGRARAATAAFDRLAVILPFEPPLWRAVGADVHYVGHPAADAPVIDAPAARRAAREQLGLPHDAVALALLPGSRAHEVRRHLGVMLAGARLLAGERPLELRVMLAGGLDPATRAWASAQVEPGGTITVDPTLGAAEALPAYDAAVVASGTATLESALAGAPPVIVYRTSPVTAWAARRLLQVAHVGLPNLLLDEAPYPEVLQDELQPENVASALRGVLATLPSFAPLPDRLRARLCAGLDAGGAHTLLPSTFARRVTALLDDWLDVARPRPTRGTNAHPG